MFRRLIGGRVNKNPKASIQPWGYMRQIESPIYRLSKSMALGFVTSPVAGTKYPQTPNSHKLSYITSLTGIRQFTRWPKTIHPTGSVAKVPYAAPIGRSDF